MDILDIMIFFDMMDHLDIITMDNSYDKEQQ